MQPYKETDIIRGYDPYGASKAASESIIACYCSAFFRAQGIGVASARASNIIGGGDWAADRLIPDAIRVWSAKRSLAVRHPDSIRPWQHVLEPLYGRLILAQELAAKPEFGSVYNFGPEFNDAVSVRRIIVLVQHVWRRAGAVGLQFIPIA